MNLLPSLRRHRCWFTSSAKTSNVPSCLSLLLVTVDLYWARKRLTVNSHFPQPDIAFRRIIFELLAIREDNRFILPTWIRWPDHSYFLKSPASTASSTTSPDLAPHTYQCMIGHRSIRHSSLTVWWEMESHHSIQHDSSESSGPDPRGHIDLELADNVSFRFIQKFLKQF